MKRRIFALFFCFILIFACALPVFADSAASYIENITTVTSNGQCQVTLRVSIRLEAVVEKLYFPVPENAKNVSLNNESARTSKSDGLQWVDISGLVGGITGTQTITVAYSLSDIIAEDEKTEKQIMTLPILCGFEYPVERMEFAITMPQNVEKKPTFLSGYMQYSVEQDIKLATQGTLISGVIDTILKDHETLTMIMDFPADTFDVSRGYVRTGNPEIIPMVIFGVLAMVYWILFMRALPLIPHRTNQPPEGLNAGELGSWLTFTGADMTMLVFHWAQLGYILIQLDDNGRVILHKRMEMGNERNTYEGKLFRSLFGKRRMVDGTGMAYARLCRKAASQNPAKRNMMKKGSGNEKIFRFLNTGIMVCCGVCMAMNLTGSNLLAVVLALILAVLGYISGQRIQIGMQRVHLRDRGPLWMALGISAAWLLLGILAGQFLIALCVVAVELLAGLAGAYSGRRNEVGRQNAGQILGLRQYLKTASKAELGIFRKSDPEYFFNMAPYAMALGVEKDFARQFGGKKLPPCSYLVAGVHGIRTAAEWAELMKEAAGILDERQKRMEYEKITITRVR